MDKEPVGEDLMLVWLQKANGYYSAQIEPLNYDENNQEYDTRLTQNVKNILAEYMHRFYQERHVSKVNKTMGMTTKGFTLDAGGQGKKYASEELNGIKQNCETMVQWEKNTVYV